MRRNVREGLVFFASLIAAIINGYIFNYINEIFYHYTSNDNGLSEFNKFTKFLIIIFIAPLVETWVFNQLPNLALKKINISSEFILIVLPSILFSLFHLYHPIYAIMAFVGGLIINFYYIHCQRKKMVAFLMVALLHASYNLYGFLFVA